MANHSYDYDPYSEGAYGTCQECDDDGPLTWSNHYGHRVCEDCAD